MQAQEDYEAAMEELRETFLRQRREFVGKYDEMLDEARKRLGTLFHADEYPDPQRLGLSFRFGWVYKPIPRSEDVTVPMTQERLDQLRESIEANVQQAVAGAVEDLYRRLHEVVGHVADRLTVDDKGDALVFRNGLIDNVREVVELMPKLNVTNDKRLIAVAKEVEKRLLVIDNPAELRPTAPQYRPEKRKAIKAAADDLAVRLAGFFGDQAMPNAA